MVSNVTPLTAFGLFPWKEIFEPKGAVPLVVEKHDEIAQDVHDSVASTFHFPTISEWLGIKDKIRDVANSLHNEALLTPDPNDDKVDFLQYLYDYVGRAPLTHFAPDWFKEIIIYITSVFTQFTHNAVQHTFAAIYKFLSTIVLWTPEWLFSDAWFSDAIIKFSAVNMGIVIILIMIQGIKRILRMKHTKLSEITKKLPIAITVSAATPILFNWGVKLLNKLTKFIISLGSGEMTTNTAYSVFSSTLMFEPVNVLFMLVFLLITGYMFIPMALYHGRRWFNLLIQGILTPFAMTAFLFKETEHYFHTWLNAIKESALKQLIYAVFTTVLGLILFATPEPSTFTGLISKLILMVGGVHLLAYPPAIITNLSLREGKGVVDMLKDVDNKRKDIVENIKTNVGKTKTKTEDVAVGAAGIAGKLYRFIKKF
jgi:hypothetical protein